MSTRALLCRNIVRRLYIKDLTQLETTSAILHTAWPRQSLLMAMVVSPSPCDLGQVLSQPTMGLYPPLCWMMSNHKEQRVSGNHAFHNNFTLSSHDADRVPRPALHDTASLFTIELRKVTMPFKMRSQREGCLCCLSRSARQHLWCRRTRVALAVHLVHVNTTSPARTTTSSGSPRNTIAPQPRRTVPYCLSVTTKEHHTPYTTSSNYTTPNPRHVWVQQLQPWARRLAP